MISMVQPLPVGNALRLFLEPLPTFGRWKVLRKASDTIDTHDDPEAIVVHDGDVRVFVDSAFLRNDERVYYRPFYTQDGANWIPGPSAYGTPAATYSEAGTDVLSFLRERLEAGLAEEVRRGNLANDLGYVQVFVATPSLEQDLVFPLVTLHLEKEEPAERSVGEEIGGYGFDAIGDDTEGWLADTSVAVIGWDKNGDGRIELRKAIRRLVLANMPLFADRGWTDINFSMEDVDAVNGEYPAPLYQAMGNFTCVAPVRVTGAPALPVINAIIP